MESLSLLKFWKSNTTKAAVDAVTYNHVTAAESTVSDSLTDFTDDDDESYFELELTLPKFTFNTQNQTTPDLKSEPRISSKPQSPISILRLASPKLRIFMFGKFRKKSKKKSDEDDVDERFIDTESISSAKSKDTSSLVTVKFRIEDGSIVPKLTRTNSSKSRRSDESSKRFSKEGVQKYLNFVNPLNSKQRSSGGGDGGERKSVSSPTRTASFPSYMKEEKQQSSRFNLRCKQFVKSKSASSMDVPSLPIYFPARNDYPRENIEDAILHCKRSLDSTIGKSSLSRCSSDPSHEKSIQANEFR